MACFSATGTSVPAGITNWPEWVLRSAAGAGTVELSCATARAENKAHIVIRMITIRTVMVRRIAIRMDYLFAGLRVTPPAQPERAHYRPAISVPTADFADENCQWDAPPGKPSCIRHRLGKLIYRSNISAAAVRTSPAPRASRPQSSAGLVPGRWRHTRSGSPESQSSAPCETVADTACAVLTPTQSPTPARPGRYAPWPRD